MKRTSLHFSALLATLFLFAFSCQDHYVPEEPEEPVAAKVVTLEIQNLPEMGHYRYRVAFETLGNVPITEYGTLVTFKKSLNDNDYNPVPVVGNFDKKILFQAKPIVGEVSIDLDLADEIAAYYEKYYRAYAVLANGSVVYGEVRNYD